MGTEPPLIIESSNLSVAWGELFLRLMQKGAKSPGPVALSIGGFDGELPSENQQTRDALDAVLEAHGRPSCDATAMTIFPYKSWNRRGRPNCNVFSDLCISRLLPRMKKRSSLNNKGTYFERMMAYEGVKTNGSKRCVNQLEFVVDLLKRERRQRQSALQIACFDPAKDHTGQPVRGFPCLQQVGISYDDDNGLAVNGFYPTQYIVDRGYGNYLGLCHLGRFIAHEAGMEFRRLTCFIGRPALGKPNKRDLETLKDVVVKQLDSNAEK